MSEASASRGAPVDPEREHRLAQLQEVVDLVADIWEPDASRIPEWMTQELTLAQLRLLFLLRDRGPMPIGHIADLLHVGLPAASGIVDRIERHGLVVREHRHDDRRVVDCSLTERGEQVVTEMVGVRRGIVRDALSTLTTEELAQLDGLLRAVVDRSGRTP